MNARELSAILEANRKTIYYLCYYYGRGFGNEDFEELVADAMWAATRAILAFDSSRGFSVNTIIRKYVINAIGNSIKTIKLRNSRFVCIDINDERIAGLLEDEREYDNPLATSWDIFSKREIIGRKDCQIIDLLLRGGTQKEIARLCKCSERTISNAKKHAANILSA